MKKIPNPWHGMSYDARMNTLVEFTLLTGKTVGDALTVERFGRRHHTTVHTEDGMLSLSSEEQQYMSIARIEFFYIEGDSDEEDS